MKRRSFFSGVLLKALAAIPLIGSAYKLFGQDGDSEGSTVEPVTSLEGVLIYDLYAMALYFDGTLGPKTGEILARDIIAAADKEYLFWHGHGGVQHQYRIQAADFEKIRSGLKVTLETDNVANHNHKFFIDPTQTKYRIPNREPIEYVPST